MYTYERITWKHHPRAPAPLVSCTSFDTAPSESKQLARLRLLHNGV